MKTQLEIAWAEPEPFALTPQTTTDGDAIARRNDQSAADKIENDKHQPFIDAIKSLF